MVADADPVHRLILKLKARDALDPREEQRLRDAVSSIEEFPAGKTLVRAGVTLSHSMLVVENGQRRALRYRARMTVGGRTHSTDVCVVLPHLPSYEYWPDPVERLELSDFRFIPWTEGRAPTCE